MLGFDKERGKTLIQQLMRKEKLRKVGFYFIIRCFIKPFTMIINHFGFTSHSQWNFHFLMSGIVKWETGNSKWLSYLVKNVTQLNFLN